MSIEFGIKKYIPSGSATSNAIKMADNYIKTNTNTDETGKVVDPTVYDSAIQSFLSPYADDLRVQSKILTLKNQQKALTTKLEDREKNVNLFKMEYQKRIDQVLRQKYTDSFDVVTKLAETNMALLSTFKEQIYDEAVGNKTLTQTIQNEYDSLNNQTTLLTEVVNARTFGAPYNPDAYGWFIKTNPNDGAIVNMEFKEATDIKEADFRKTDSTYGTVPIFLYSYGATGKKQGNLGGVVFDESDDGILKSRGFLEKAGGFTSRLFAGIIPGGETWKGKGEKQREFPMANVPYNSLSIPKESVVKDGLGNYFWFDNQGKLNKSNSADELKGFLASVGKNSQDVDNHFYLALPEFIDQFWKSDETGKKSVLETKKPALPTTGVVPSVISAPVSVPPTPSVTPSRTIDWSAPFFPEPIRTAAKQIFQPFFEESPEFETGKYKPKQVIEKGKPIFKSMYEK